MHETFSALKKDFESLQDTIVIDLEGGGSRTGLNAIRNNEAEIGLSSFGFNLDSLLGVEHGVIEKVVAYDGIVLINNGLNPIKQLSNDQVNAIYTGSITDWNLIGGNPGMIKPIVRDSNSGTQRFFTEYFNIDTVADSAEIADRNVDIVAKVIENKNAIGFIGFAYFSMGVNDILIPAINPTDSLETYILPSSKTINQNTYPLKRPLRIYHTKNSSPQLSVFLNYLNTSRAASIVESFGLMVQSGKGG